MARIRLPALPDRSRVQAARVAAARVAAASAQATVTEQVDAVAAGIPPTLSADLADLEARLTALETA